MAFQEHAASPADLSRLLAHLRDQGFTDAHYAQLHHFSVRGHAVTLSRAIKYFSATSEMREKNARLGDRCRYVAENLSKGESMEAAISGALLRWPLLADQPADVAYASNADSATPSLLLGGVSRQKRGMALGRRGELIARQLLIAKGYRAHLCRPNFPTYDIDVFNGPNKFQVSVKVARRNQQLMLGSRASTARLSEGHFLFAFIPNEGAEVDFKRRDWRLLILPAMLVRDHAIEAHDAYWRAKGVTSSFPILVKASNAVHQAAWARWLEFEEAWEVLPTPLHGPLPQHQPPG